MIERNSKNKKSTMRNRSHSSFWLGSKNFNRLKKSDNMDPMELVKYQRSVAKFVKILTKESIPVTFTTDGSSHTDGQTVTISSKINQKNFDSIVGLALHEGSHIQLTDFSVLPNYETAVRKMLQNRFGMGYTESNEWVDELVDNRRTYQSLLNYVEDRRIDHYVYTNSPGYKPYYEAMYDRYFNDHVIDKAVASNEYTDVTVQSYMFRIINFLNENTRFDALPRLEEMYNLIFDNVSSIDSTQESMDIAFKIYRMIKDEVEKAEAEKEKQEQSQQNDGDSEGSNSTTEESSNEDGMNTQMDGEGDSMEESDGSGGDSSGDDESDESDGESSDGGGSETDETDSDEDEDSDGSGDSDSEESEEESDEDEESGKGKESKESDDGEESQNDDSDNDSDGESESEESNRPELTERQKRILPQKQEKQEKFLDGETRKVSIDKATKETVDALAQADIDQEDIDFEDEFGYAKQMQVSLVRGFNDNSFKLFDSIARRKQQMETGHSDGLTEAVQSGIRLGRRLGKKLQIRNRERTTTYNRKKKGKLDKRRIHALGHGSTNVFNQYVTEKHEDAFVHISIDGSGSMNSNDKFKNSIKSAVAMAQMADMTNIDIQISIRYTGIIGNKDQPILWVVYDSRKDSMKVIKKYFKYLRTMGMTPEGLCFAKIMEELPVGSDALNTYFINYSDGMPWFSNYDGNRAVEHTAGQVKELKKRGYKVLSFFIDGGNGNGERSKFENMYGRDASFIDPTKLTQLVKTLQKMFMKR